MTRFRYLAAAAAGTLLTALGGVATASAGDGLGLSGTQLAADQIGYSKNIEHISNTPHVGPFAGQFGTDLAFQGDRAYVGNYQGFIIYDISEPTAPVTLAQVNCPGAQNDISVSGDLVYLSTDSSRSDDSCQSTGQSVADPSSWEGIKIFDVSDPTAPEYIKSVETACGSHTHTLLPGEGADYLYVSSYGPSKTAADCEPPHDLISIVKVPHDAPTTASVVATPVLFPKRTGNTNTSGCHDITVYPSKNIAAGACMGDGVIMDISDPEAPEVVETVRDENFAFWHSATFNSDATKVVFTDELGGGGGATCNEAIGPNRGANAIYDLSASNELTFKSYFKIPRHQANTENCVAHNGSIIPVEGRDVMVQSWYQGGVSLWEFTDSTSPTELDWFERGPLSPTKLGGSWSAYYYNGLVYSSDIQKGFDVLMLKDPTLRTANSVKLDQLNVQSQPVYPIR
jgi:hypothetical protein